MSQKYEDILKNSVEKLSLGPNDILIVKSQEAMSTFLEMTQQGIGFSKYANPILLVPGGLEKATRDDIIAWCRQNLAGYKCPRYVVFTELPRTSTGKIQKFKLRDMAKAV